MSLLPAPTSLEDLAEQVRATPRLLPVGAGTKPGLTAGVDCPRLPLTGLRGITAYDPADFTLTALAGTPLAEINATIRTHQQALPFDPLFVESGATLGGTVAANVNGPGRFARGGLRDSVLGVTFIDGRGEQLTVGSRVVKNVAGFDLPKFFVGSLGRHGVLAELTLKLCPLPPTPVTLRLPVATEVELVETMARLAASPAEPDAIDARLGDGSIHVRFVHGESARQAALITAFGGEIVDNTFWSETTRFAWASPGDVWLKVPVGLARVGELLALIRDREGVQVHLTAAGAAAWLSLPTQDTSTRQALTAAGFPSLQWRGSGPITAGLPPLSPVEQRVAAVLDPVNRFPPLPCG